MKITPDGAISRHLKLVAEGLRGKISKNGISEKSKNRAMKFASWDFKICRVVADELCYYLTQIAIQCQVFKFGIINEVRCLSF
jgi:hypothetical protein